MLMQVRYLLLASILFAPGISAQTADIPALTGTGTAEERFIAGWATADGGSVPVGTTQFMTLFGDSAPRNTQTDSIAQATFNYTATNFRVSANVANCGGLGAGQSFSFALQKNGVDTTLTGSCVNGAAANSFTLDTDTVSIVVGDRLNFRVSATGGVLAPAIRVGLSLEGFKEIPVEITTEPVPDMTNEIIDAFNLIAPILFFVIAVIWAEITKHEIPYLLAVLLGMAATLAVWTEIEGLRFALVIATLGIAFRAYQEYDRAKGVEN